MTKKDYIRAAEILRLIPNPTTRGVLRDAFADFFASENDRFDRSRWNEAIDEGTVRARAGTRPRPLRIA